MKFELHPLCALFPRMSGTEFEALKEDIRANGLRHPIITHNGMILDGGNRYQACIDLGIKPLMTEYTGDNLVTYVLSANFFRRHLSAGQQAAIVASAQDWAKAHPAHRKEGGNVAGLSTVAHRAAQSGASERTQRMADAVAKKSPDLAVKVAHGEISLPKAAAQLEKPKTVKPALAVVHAVDPDDDYSDMDAAHDQIEALQSMLAVASMGNAPETDKSMAQTLIAELRAEVNTLRATLKAVTQSRDTLMNELAQVKRQCIGQQRELKSLKAAAHA